jgi:hypothetical protein
MSLMVSEGRAEQAKAFSEEYPAVVTLENVAGVVAESVEVGDSNRSDDSTTIGLFNNSPGALAPVTRLGFHYFVLPPLSVGVIGHFSEIGDVGRLIVIAGRIGVAFPIATGTAFWPRVGAGYFNFTTHEAAGDSGGGPDIEGGWIGGELFLVLQPVEHFGFIVGPMVEVSVAGKRGGVTVCSGLGQCSSPSRDFAERHYGFTFGVLTDF